jgi:hypothetical protein
MKLALFCCLFPGLLYGSEPSGKKEPWETVNPNRPWSKAPNDERTWFEWYNGFRMKRVYQYACAIPKNDDCTPLFSIESMFSNQEQFKQDREQKNWLHFCETETKTLLNAPIDLLTPYQVERFYDCCGAPLRHAMQSQPQKYRKMIELVNATEQYLIAAKALEKIKSQK